MKIIISFATVLVALASLLVYQNGKCDDYDYASEMYHAKQKNDSATFCAMYVDATERQIEFYDEIVEDEKEQYRISTILEHRAAKEFSK